MFYLFSAFQFLFKKSAVSQIVTPMETSSTALGPQPRNHSRLWSLTWSEVQHGAADLRDLQALTAYELWKSLQSVVMTFHILGNVSFPSLDKNCEGSVCTAGGAAETKHAAWITDAKKEVPWEFGWRCLSIVLGTLVSHWSHEAHADVWAVSHGPIKPSHWFKKENKKWFADVINFFFCSSADSSLFALLLVSVKLNIKTVKCWQAATLPDPLGFNVSAQQRPLWPQKYWRVKFNVEIKSDEPDGSSQSFSLLKFGPFLLQCDGVCLSGTVWPSPSIFANMFTWA